MIIIEMDHNFTKFANMFSAFPSSRIKEILSYVKAN